MDLHAQPPWIGDILHGGVGGLGLVAMAAAVALDVPRIGQTVALGLVLGGVIAAIMIHRRRSVPLRIALPAHLEKLSHPPPIRTRQDRLTTG